MPMIDTVTFDVWNTLLVHEFYDDRLQNARIDSIVKVLDGLNISRDDVVRAYDRSEDHLKCLWEKEEDLGLDGHLQLLLEGLGLPMSFKETIREPYAKILLSFRPKPVDGASDLLKDLKDKGYRIGLVSNTGRTPGETMKIILDGYGMLQYFDSMSFSCDVGHIKPGKRIFELALEGLHARPGSSVHVGDSMLLDIYGAKTAGMKAILFNKYSEGFEQYATKYYSANGRHEEPDAVVCELPEVEGALQRMGGK
ncbi:MAG TPA: HAD family hydrolase [Methanocellaceae archaeon]